MSETQVERDNADCTVVYCGKCNLTNLLCVTSHLDAEFAGELRVMVANGCSVAHMPVLRARENKWCHCWGTK